MSQKMMSDLEEKVMEIIWEKKACKVKEIVTSLCHKKPLAYTTVATILHRLSEKGLVKRLEQGSGYQYIARVSKEKYSKNLTSSFMQKLLATYGDTALVSFADSIESLPKEKREYLFKLLTTPDIT